MPFLKTGIKKSLFRVTALIIIVFLASPFFLTRIINSFYIKNKISGFIYQKTSLHIDTQKFSIRLFPSPVLTVKNFNYHLKSGLDADIDLIKFNINFQKILQGKIDIDHISVDNPRIKTSPDNVSQKKITSLKSFHLAYLFHRIIKIFDLLPVYQDSVELKFKNAATPYFSRMDGSFYLSRIKRQIIFNTSIKDIILTPLMLSSDIFNKYLNIKLIKLNGLKLIVKLNSKGEINGHCTLMDIKLMSENHHLLFNSQRLESKFKLSENFTQIDIKPFKSIYPAGSLSIHFLTCDLKKTSEINFLGTDIHVDQAKQMALALFKDNYITRTLFKILKNGIVPEVKVSFKSKYLKNLFKPDNLFLKGKIKNGRVNIPETHLTASGVAGKASIIKGVLDIISDKAVIDVSKIEKTRLTIDMFNHNNFPFQGDFQIDADLSMIPQTLAALLPDTLLAEELSSVHGVSGHAKTFLKLVLKPGDNNLLVKVSTQDFAVKAYYDRIPGEIVIKNVNFNYEPDKIDLKRLTGTINSSTIYDLTTSLDLGKKPFITIKSGKGKIFLHSIIPWLMSFDKTRNLISPVKKGTGEILIKSINLSGPVFNPDMWDFDLKGSGSAISLSDSLDEKPIENLSGIYHFSKNILALSQVKMKINKLSWLQSFIKKKYLNSIRVPFEMENGDFQIKTKQCLFKSNFKFSGGPELFIDLKGKTPFTLTANLIHFSDPKLSEGSIGFDYHKDKPLLDFNGILRTQTLNKLIIPDSFFSKQIKAFTEGQPVILKADKDSSLTIITKTIDLNPLLTHPIGSLKGRRLIPEKIINFKADKLKIKKLILTDIDSKLSFKKNHSFCKFNNALLCDLKTSGYINFKKDIIYARFPIEARNKKNIQDLLTCLFQKNNFMDGQYSLFCNLLSRGTQKNILHNFSGNLKFKAEKGRIYELTLLSRILSVLNFSKLFKGNIPDVVQKGFAYNSISIEADIKDSKIYLKKAIIDGQDMTLIFSGWIDPLKDEIDMVCLVAPFKTIDLIIEHIPIVNTLLGGRLVSIPVKASGSISDPVVIPLHPSAVGKGLVNMMSDILKTPVKLWDKINGQ